MEEANLLVSKEASTGRGSSKEKSPIEQLNLSLLANAFEYYSHRDDYGYP